MPQSLSRLLVHIVFSTKNRERWLDDALRPELFTYMAVVGRSNGCEVYRVGGVIDHVHLAIDLGRTVTTAGIVRQLKLSSAGWLRDRSREHRAFLWQAGYGAFTLGQPQLPKLIDYIDRQEEHHRKIGFQDEFRRLLAKNQMEGDERYLWD
ncbi:IS200/IS605 family transposase [Luteolibacter sp. LG18]|uniref:IS200/IS605 family transposase n=1 Tax=Luteolibacter sp. LG18 TaxID=2819286 RepID=UPI002B2D4D87|nr:hypothetical protein llg_24840 [Luteolibacter sp. LG18]